jgi:hypothetical protein
LQTHTKDSATILCKAKYKLQNKMQHTIFEHNDVQKMKTIQSIDYAVFSF